MPVILYTYLSVGLIYLRKNLMMQLYSKALIIIYYVWVFSTDCLKLCELCATAHLRAHQRGVP